MGNRRTVNMVGICDDPDAIRAALKEPHYGPLTISDTLSLGGLADWPAKEINAIGNCYERDFDVQDIYDDLRKAATADPTLHLDCHCGGDYESLDCEATIRVCDGELAILPPQVKTLMAQSEEAAYGRLMQILRDPRL